MYFQRKGKNHSFSCRRENIMLSQIPKISRVVDRHPSITQEVQGSSKKDARFSLMKNMPDLLSDDREGKIIEISTLDI